MILPIGHEEGGVRRLPWVTISLIGVCLLVFLFTDTNAAQPSPEGDAIEQAADYWRQRAYLKAHPVIREHVSYDVMPNQRKQYLATLPDLSPYGPEEDGGLVPQQAELDRLTDLALGIAGAGGEQNAFTRWGVVPSSLSASAFLTYMFIHAGWMHLIGNLFMLMLAGPPIEDRWGRTAFSTLYVLGGVFSAVFFLGFAGDASAPLVGASGAIAAVLGAFVVRLWSTQIRFAYFFLFGLRPIWGTFEAPAWAMLSLWFANEVFQAVLWDSMGVASGVAYWAHVGGFAFGIGAAFAVRALQIEERYVNPGVEASLVHFSANPVLEDAMAVRERGDVAEAFAMLETEWQRQPDDEIGLALWDAALACDRAEAAAPALIAAIRSAIKRGEHDLALRHWSELSDRLPEALLDPTTLMRFAPALLAENQRDRAALAVRQAVHPSNTALSPGQALRAVELARELDPPSAVRAARLALASPDLHEAKRAKLVALIEELAGAGVAEEEPAAPVLAPEAEAPVWDEVGVVELARYARAKLIEARPSSLEAEGIRLVLDGDRHAQVAYPRIQAVAVAIVSGLAPAPILLIDLIANWNVSEAEALQGIRLRSDRFDPRALLGTEGDAQQAFRTLVGRLLEVTRAQPLPTVEHALGNPFARYDSLADYERIVLEVAE